MRSIQEDLSFWCNLGAYFSFQRLRDCTAEERMTGPRTPCSPSYAMEKSGGVAYLHRLPRRRLPFERLPLLLLLLLLHPSPSMPIPRSPCHRTSGPYQARRCGGGPALGGMPGSRCPEQSESTSSASIWRFCGKPSREKECTVFLCVLFCFRIVAFTQA